MRTHHQRTPWLLVSVAFIAASGSHGACLPSGCGAPSLSREEANAIVQVDLDATPICMGTIIAPGWVLTARHCVIAQDHELVAADRLRVHRGEHPLLVRTIHVQPLAHTHDEAVVADLAGADIALIRVADADGALPMTDDVNAPLFALVSGALQRADVRSVEDAQVFTSGVTCGGDSGGPLLDAHHHIVGVASWRTPGACGTGTSVFTRIAPHRDWMETTLRSE